MKYFLKKEDDRGHVLLQLLQFAELLRLICAHRQNGHAMGGFGFLYAKMARK